MAPDLDDGIELYAGDVRDPEAWDRCFLRHGPPDVVVHLAAETGTGQSLTEASRHGSTNVVGTTQLTDALVRHSCMPQHILVASSRAVYGEGAWSSATGGTFYPPPRSARQLAEGQWDPISPDGSPAVALPHDAGITWPRPTNVYAATKLAQEHVLESWTSAYNVPLSILRLQNVFGPGQAVGNAYTGVLTLFARQISNDEQVDVYEDGRILRDFVFVDDVVDAFVSSIGRTPIAIRRIDIGGRAAATLFDVATVLCELGAAPLPLISGTYRLGDVRAASADLGNATEIGWTPATDLRSGLASMLEWVSVQP